MKSLTVGLIVLANCLAHSQPTPEWISPQGRDSASIGWTMFEKAPEDYRFFQMGRPGLRIMSGPYSTTPAFTIPLMQAELDKGGLQPYFSAYRDISGDGVNDIWLYRHYGASPPYREGFRSVNPVTGQDIIVLDEQRYSYSPWWEADLDNDGVIEIVVRREPFPATTDHSYEYRQRTSRPFHQHLNGLLPRVVIQ
jgi:hypothetical protein